MWGIDENNIFNPIVMPIVTTTNFVNDPGIARPKFSYSRDGNPSRDSLEQKLAKLEDANFGLCFSSGMTALLGLVTSFVKPNDHVICSNRSFIGTMRFLMLESKRIHFDVTFVDLLSIENLKSAIRSTTNLVILEVVTNPTLRIINLQAVSNLLTSHPGILLAVDNSLLTPCIMKPLKHGADIVLHSATKILNGHGDVTMGVLLTNRKDLYDELYKFQSHLGVIPSPFDCYLVERSLKTLRLRVREHCFNALKISEYLQTHPAVETVFFPGLPNHPEHELGKLQLKDFGGVVSLYLRAKAAEIHEFIRRLKLFKSSWGLGLVDSVVFYPWTWFLIDPVAPLPENERASSEDITENFVRLWVGVEDVTDLIDDLKQSLDKLITPV